MTQYGGPPPEPPWIEKQFLHTGWFILILFALCCSLPAFLFGLIGMIMTQNQEARNRALVLMIVSAAVMVVWFALGFMQGLNEAMREMQ